MGRGGSGVLPIGEKIQVDFTWRGKRWRPLLNLKPTPSNLRYAERVRHEIIERIRHGTFVFADYFSGARNAPADTPSKPKTFAEYAELWMKSKGKLAESTKWGYQSSLDAHLLPTFGARLISDIRHSEIASFMGGDWSSAKTRNNALIPLRGVFGMAMRDGAITRNPSDGVTNERHQPPEVDPWTREEADAIVARIRSMYGAEANYFEFAFWSGLRTSELVELRWSDVDLPAGLVRVTRARVRGVLKGTKTHVSRTVTLNARARAALGAQRPISQLASDYVFMNLTTREPYADDQIPRRRFKAAVAALKYRLRDVYQTRHSYASWCLMAGANPTWLAAQLGHSTEVLFRTYGKWIARADQGREMARVESALLGEPQKATPDRATK